MSLTSPARLGACVAAALAVLLAVHPPALRGQSVEGQVIDAASGAPVPSITIALRPDDAPARFALSDAEGRFRFLRVQPGEYRIVVGELGYDTARAALTVGSGDEIAVTVRLVPRAVALDPLVVSVTPEERYLRAVGFDERREQGWGRFYSAEKLNRLIGAFPSQKLRQIPGVRRNLSMRGCNSPEIIVDGMHLTGIPLDEALGAVDIVGIEVYDTPMTVPVEFRRQRTCGAVVLWTR